MRDRRVLGALLLINVLWSPVNVFLRTALGGGFSAVALAGTRWAAFAGLLTLLGLFPGVRRRFSVVVPRGRDLLGAVAVGFLLFGPAHAMYYFGLSRTSSFEGTALGTTAPIWVALGAFLGLGERPEPRRLVAIGLGFVGAWGVSVGWNAPDFRDGHQFGNGVYLVAVVMESAAGILATRILRRTSGLGVLWAQSVGAGLALPVLALALPAAFPWTVHAPTPGALASLGYLVFVAGLVNFGIWYTLAERAPLSLMVVSILLQPPLSLVFGMAFLGERPDFGDLSGTALILVGLAVAASGGARDLRPVGEQVADAEREDG